MNSLVSICIPTYRQTHLLKQNFDSIRKQSYNNYEVLVSDDSPDDHVFELVQKYLDFLPIKYFRNKPSLGSPKNWNSVLLKAAGDFVILLHHDDQFSEKDSLKKYVDALTNDKEVMFVFGRNEGIEALTKGAALKTSYFKKIYDFPPLLITGNILGAPSNILFRRSALQFYDERFKWIVDIESYTHLFKQRYKLIYLDENIVTTGRHEGQITNFCQDDTTTLIVENVTYAIENIKVIKNLKVFDFYWRLFRNNSVRGIGDLEKFGINPNELPHFLIKIVHVQNKIPAFLLNIGVFSKGLMSLTYLLSK